MTAEDIISKVQLGMCRITVEALLGKPDDTGGTSRKYRLPAIWKYGDVELHFALGKDSLALVYREETEDVTEIVIK